VSAAPAFYRGTPDGRGCRHAEGSTGLLPDLCSRVRAKRTLPDSACGCLPGAGDLSSFRLSQTQRKAVIDREADHASRNFDVRQGLACINGSRTRDGRREITRERVIGATGTRTRLTDFPSGGWRTSLGHRLLLGEVSF
jgi:hypothetical protein